MNNILLKVQMFLDKANRGEATIPDHLVEEFAELCKQVLIKQFNTPRKNDFTIRMSNIGRPLCQLQMEQAGAPQEAPSPFDKMKFTFGDLTEALAMVILKASGVNVVGEQGAVKWEGISGTYDVKIDEGDGPKIYDLKSASPFAFAHKFGPDASYNALAESDTFGYISQGFGYAEADGVPFGGWIAIDKSSGEWNVMEVPEGYSYERERKNALTSIVDTKEKIDFGSEFKRCFTDKPETWYKQPTGNRVLNSTCEYCPFKFTCWPDLKVMPSAVSTGFNPRMVYYTHYDAEKTAEFVAARDAKKRR